MSSQNQVSVCNLALLAIGARASVSSIKPSDGSTQADACTTLYTYIFEQLARTARWGCLNKQITLTLLQAAQGTPENPQGTTLPIPAQPWMYAYQLPSDSLMVRAILPPVLPFQTQTTPQTTLPNAVTSSYPGVYQIPYAIGYSADTSGNPVEVILTNQQQAVGIYTVNNANPQIWDSLFTSAYVASLAAYLVPALSLQQPLMQIQIKIAESMIAQARAMDGNETPVTQDHEPDWMRARNGATGWQEYFGYGYRAYGEMNWPLG